MVKISKSRINTLETCPFMFKLKYIDYKPQDFPDSVATKMGKEMHKIFEEFFIVIDLDEIKKYYAEVRFYAPLQMICT